MSKIGIKTVPQPLYSPDLAPCDSWLIPKLRGCRYETIEEMKEAVTKGIDALTHEDFRGAFQKLLEQYNKCIAARGDYFEGDQSFMSVLSIKVPIPKKFGNLSYAPRKSKISCVQFRQFVVWQLFFLPYLFPSLFFFVFLSSLMLSMLLLAAVISLSLFF